MKTMRACLLLAILIPGGAALAAPKPAANSVAVADGGTADDAPGKIAGIEIARPNGGFLGLQIVNNNFVLSFYDAKKKKIPPDVARAALRWPVKYQPNAERTVLNPGSDGTSLDSARTVRPPHNFKVFMSLFAEGKEDPVENYTVDYRE